MQRIARILALALVTIWLPATLHCAMEAAGVLPSSFACDAPGSDRDHCSNDHCEQLETGMLKQSVDYLRVATPELHAYCTCLLCLQLQSRTLGSIVDLSPAGFAQPLDWVVRWHFEHRTALLARAPSSLA